MSLVRINTWLFIMGAAIAVLSTPDASGQGSTTTQDGYMVAGELWTTIKPLNTYEFNHVEEPRTGWQHFLTIGPNGTDWRNPGSHWPGGYDLVQTWRDGKRIVFPYYDGDGTFRFAYYKSTLPGAKDPSREYKRDAHFTDATRTHLIYEAGFPTDIGIDYKIRAHQYTINEQNLNDFVAIEITMTNTGEVDLDGNGVADQSGHTVSAIAAALWVEPTVSIRIKADGGRSNRFGAGRTVGYAGATDSLTGEPYDLFYWFANVPDTRFEDWEVPAVGTRLLGVNDVATLEGYTDVWSGHRFVGAKTGSIVDNDLGAISASSPDKLTMFGTHPVGTGARKGWYGSMQWDGELFDYNDPIKAFRAATATWYEDYGKSEAFLKNLNPNQAFFEAGNEDDVTSFVVGDPTTRPNGDIKYGDPADPPRGQNAPLWEDALIETEGDFYSAVGTAISHDFSQKFTIGSGPYTLDVGESMTLVVAEFAGFRFEGLADAARAVEWAWERGWDVSADMPVPPAPDILVGSGDDANTTIQWTDVAALAADAETSVNGYKIYRSSRKLREHWLDKGFRFVDNYHHQNTVGENIEPFLDPVNPYFDAEAEFVDDVQGTYQGAEWGPYELIAVIPTADLAQYVDNSGGYDYTFIDTSTEYNSTYWYYVAAYRDGSFAGPQGTVDRIESSNFNRNGRNSPQAQYGEIRLETPWGGSYPWAFQSAGYPPAGTRARKNIGASYTVPASSNDTNDADDADNADDSALHLFPNPTDSDVTVEVAVDEAGTLELEVFDLLGRRLVRTSHLVSVRGIHRFELPTNDLVAGVYLVVATRQNGVRSSGVVTKW